MRNYLNRPISLLLTLILCFGLLSGLTVNASAVTLEERQQAIMAVAFAYFDKGHSLQYDGSTMNKVISRTDYGKTRSTYKGSPETYTPHETGYTVCSDYPCQVYWEAFGYEIMGNEGKVWTRTLAREGGNEPYCVWKYVKADGLDVVKEFERMLTIAQPGDIFTEFAKNGGHTMIWAGDITGDGKPDIIHSGGSHYNKKTRLDKREYKTEQDPEIDDRYEKSIGATTNGGTIRISDAESYVRERYLKGNRQWLSLLRPAMVMTDQDYPIPAKTRYRMTHPRLAIDRTLSKTRFNSALTGETVTMTLKLSNSSTQDYTVPVTEKAPAGAKIKTPFPGATVEGDTMKFDVELKAGDVKTFTAEYEITAAFGETVVFDGGMVGDIPSNSIPIQVGGAKLNADDTAKLAAIAKGEYDQVLKDAKANAQTLGDVVYQNILGLKVRVPSYKTVTSKFIKPVKTPTDKKTNVFLGKNDVAAGDLPTYRNMVQNLWWGASMWCKLGSDRCSNPGDMYLEPGDVVVRSSNLASAAKSEQMVYLGGGKYLTYDAEKGTYPIVEEPEFWRCILYKVFYVLRPTQAAEDVHALTELPADTEADAKLKFTDVKESDWFYTYVKDLVDRGTVNGMTETTFEPNGNLTWGQALKLIALAAREEAPAKSGSHWASGYMNLAKEKKWLDKDVDLDAKITRVQLCQVAAKAAQVTDQPDKNPFTDTKDRDVLALVKAEVINGVTETTFEPDSLLTRAQITKIIWAMLSI